jgi:polar amino acid transport system substrate-binding protein
MMLKSILRLVAPSFIASFADIAYVNAASTEKQGFDEGIAISIVDDEAEWPPYTYYQRINGEKTPGIVGFSIDVITKIFSQAGIEFTVELLPWKRALFNVARGEKNQLILNSSHVKEREVDYLYSLAHYTLQHVIFYSATKYPEGLVLKDMEDLNTNYKICGLRGYSYGSAGVDTNKVNLSFGTYDQLIHVLHNRPEICDLFIEGYEILAGFKVIGSDYLADKNLKYGVIPGLSSKGYHMLISKNLSYSKELKEIIDKGILLLRESGELDLLLAKYGLIH